MYIVWADETPLPDPGNDDILFVRSINNGQTFSDPDNISENPTGSSDPQITTIGNNVYLVWVERTSGQSDLRNIFFALSTNNGQDFSTPENISQHTDGRAIGPEIAVTS